MFISLPDMLKIKSKFNKNHFNYAMPKFVFFIFNILLVSLLGIVDYLTGWELGFFVFYFIPVSLTAWYANRNYAIAMAVLCAITWFLADYLLDQHYSSYIYAIWNSLIRLVSFIIVALTIVRIKHLLNIQTFISTKLEETLSEVKTLHGLLPICSVCKKIRNGKGYWEQVDAYLTKRSTIEFTHSICEECAKNLYGEYIIEDSLNKCEKYNESHKN